MSLIEIAAKAYASSYGLRVLPVDHGKNVCTRPNWQNLATDDTEKIGTWFSETPTPNIGILCDRVFCLDIDTDKGGDANYGKLRAALGNPPELPEDLTASPAYFEKSPGGHHLVFVVPEGVKTRRRQGVYPGVDLLGAGYFVAAPSIRNDEKYTDGEYVANHDFSWINIPNQLAELSLNGTRDDHAPVETKGKIPEGRRHDALIRFTGHLRRGGIETYEDILAAIRGYNRGRCEPPSPDKELMDIARDAARWPGGRPLPEKKVIAPMDVTELVKLSIPPLVYAADGLIPRGQLTGIFGAPFAAKSTLTRQLAVAVACGRDWLGRKTTKGRVLYFAYEDPRRRLRDTFQKLGGGALEPGSLFVYSIEDLRDVAPERRDDFLEAAIAEYQPLLTVVDTFGRHIAQELDFNDYGKMVARLSPFQNRAVQFDTAIVVNGHDRKGATGAAGINNVLGSAGIAATCDVVIGVARDDDERRSIATRGQRDGTTLPETYLIFDEGTQTSTLGETVRLERIQVMEKNIITELARKKEDWSTQSAIEFQVDGKATTIRSTLEEMADRKVLQFKKDGKAKLYRIPEDSPSHPSDG